MSGTLANLKTSKSSTHTKESTNVNIGGHGPMMKSNTLWWKKPIWWNLKMKNPCNQIWVLELMFLLVVEANSDCKPPSSVTFTREEEFCCLLSFVLWEEIERGRQRERERENPEEREKSNIMLGVVLLISSVMLHKCRRSGPTGLPTALLCLLFQLPNTSLLHSSFSIFLLPNPQHSKNWSASLRRLAPSAQLR